MVLKALCFFLDVICEICSRIILNLPSKAIVLRNVRMLRTMYTMEIYLVSLLPPYIVGGQIVTICLVLIIGLDSNIRNATLVLKDCSHFYYGASMHYHIMCVKVVIVRVVLLRFALISSAMVPIMHHYIPNSPSQWSWMRPVGQGKAIGTTWNVAAVFHNTDRKLA